MRQSLSEYDERSERNDGFRLVGEERPAEHFGEYAEEALRGGPRLPAMLLTGLVMAVFAGAVWFAYVQGARHAAPTAAPGDGVPLLHADQGPIKVKPEQPGGMKVPDQNVSLYNDKPGAPTVERLLPPPEKPLPRPVAPPPAAATAPPAAAVAPPAAAPAPTAAPSAPAVRPAAKAEPPGKLATAKPAAPAPEAVHSGKIQVRLGSLRSPEAARTEWTRLKSSNPDLLGKLTAVAVRTDLGDKGIYYRIEAGPFADPAAAERLCGEMKRRNLGCILAR